MPMQGRYYFANYCREALAEGEGEGDGEAGAKAAIATALRIERSSETSNLERRLPFKTVVAPWFCVSMLTLRIRCDSY